MPRTVYTIETLTQLARDASSLPYSLGHGSPNSRLFKHQETTDRATARRANLVAKKRRVLTTEDQARGTPHSLGRHPLRLRPRQTHGHGTIDGGLEHESEESRARGAEGRGRVHLGGGQVDDVTDALEDPGDEAQGLRGQGGLAVGDDGHALAHDARRVGAGAHDAAAAVHFGVLDGDGAVQDDLELLDGDAGADADEELAVQRLAHAGLVQEVLDGPGLAGQKHDVRLHHGRHVLLLHHLDARAVLPEGLLHALRGLGAPHAGDEPRGQAGGDFVARRRASGGLEGSGAAQLLDRCEDAREDGDAHGAYMHT